MLYFLGICLCDFSQFFFQKNIYVFFISDVLIYINIKMATIALRYANEIDVVANVIFL